MASIAPSSSKKWGRRSLDAPINLVPYIDLMVTIITFLMMTAVWTQITALEVQNGSDAISVPVTSHIKSITVTLANKGLFVAEDGAQARIIAKADGNFNLTELSKEFKQFKETDTNRFQVNVQVQDGIGYENVIEVIDLAIGMGLSGVTLKPWQS